MKTYIETLRIKKVFAGWYEVVGHHRDHTITIVRSEDDSNMWQGEGEYYSSLKDAKASVFQELATEHAEIYAEALEGEV